MARSLRPQDASTCVVIIDNNTYRLAYVVRGECVVRFDSEAGKGDHRHFGAKEAPYRFRNLEGLQVDFWEDVAKWGK